jgi:hypothetical protein
MKREKIGVTMSLGMLFLAGLAPVTAGADVIPREVIQGRKPVIQLGVTGVTTTHYEANLPFCHSCASFDRHRFVSRQITIFDDHTLQSTDAFNELEAPGAFAQSVSGLGPPQSFARLVADIEAADLPEQADGCGVILTLPAEAVVGNLTYSTTATLNHDYVLIWFGPGKTDRILRSNARGSDCPTELRKIVVDILSYEQEVIGATPLVQATQ